MRICLYDMHFMCMSYNNINLLINFQNIGILCKFPIESLFNLIVGTWELFCYYGVHWLLCEQKSSVLQIKDINYMFNCMTCILCACHTIIFII